MRNDLHAKLSVCSLIKFLNFIYTLRFINVFFAENVCHEQFSCMTSTHGGILIPSDVLVRATEHREHVSSCNMERCFKN